MLWGEENLIDGGLGHIDRFRLHPQLNIPVFSQHGLKRFDCGR